MNKLKYLPLLALLFATQLQAQTKRIEIQGYGEMKVAPDQGILQININTHKMEFGEAIASLSKKESQIIKKLESLGYKKSEIRTSNFSVRENTIWRNGTQYDSGFIASQYMSMEFPNSKDRIAKILNTLSDGNTDAEINFGFKLSDKLTDELSAQVLEKAVNDARKNADLLAKYSGVTIKSVLKIEYHTSQQSPTPYYNDAMEMAPMNIRSMKSSSGSEGFQAQDITLSDRVTIHYEIAEQ